MKLDGMISNIDKSIGFIHSSRGDYLWLSAPEEALAETAAVAAETPVEAS
jgi:hypothetical protein